ncbi:MAG: hypothetical protein EBZ81_16370, partial [Betaproteobacteria bacterium]|nr:hypothetical protein [Betaproteobacteria bacterium]
VGTMRRRFALCNWPTALAVRDTITLSPLIAFSSHQRPEIACSSEVAAFAMSVDNHDGRWHFCQHVGNVGYAS